MTITRKAQRLIRIKARKCSLTNGLSPCTATETCYNTRKTCQDLENYDETTQDLNFIQASETLPEVTGLLFPSLRSVSTIETEINPGALTRNVSALGKRAEITITLTDFVHHDRGLDPYYSTRTREPSGTFWSRWLRRNYYPGTIVEDYNVIDGVLDTTPKKYIIQDISTSDSGATVIKAFDILRDLWDKTVPEVSTGVLASDISDTQTTFIVNGGSYPASGTIVMGSEAMDFTQTGGNFTVVRGDEPASYSSGDTVQLAKVYTNQTPDDVVNDLIVTEGGIDSSFVDTAAWAAEVALWLPAVRLTRTIGKPTKITELLSQIAEETLLSIYVNQDSQEIDLVAYKPSAPTKTLTDDTGLVDSGVKIMRDDEPRINVVTIRYAMRDQLGDTDDAANFARVKKTVANTEVINRFDGKIKEREIFAKWLDDTQDAQALILGSLVLQEGQEQRVAISFTLEFKDSDANISDVVEFEHRELVDLEGYPEATAAILVAKSEIETGSRYGYKAIVTQYANIRFGQISPDEFTFDLLTETGDYDLLAGDLCDQDFNYLPLYCWPYWTAEQRAQYVWLSDGNNNFFDGEPPYQLA